MIFDILNLQNLTEIIVIEEASHITPWSRDVFERCFKAGYRAIGVKIAEKLVGFAIYSVVVRECHLLNICVHPDVQNQGCGFALLRYVLENIKKQGIEVVFLEVRCSNHAALNLYDKLGFIKIGERKNYYLSPNGREDAWIFAKDLGVA